MRPVGGVIAVLVLVGACSSDDDTAGGGASLAPTESTEPADSTGTTTPDATTPDDPGGPIGEGTVTLVAPAAGFEVDTCYVGDGLDHSPTLRVDIEGTGTDAEGRAFEIQFVRTVSPTGHEIDVVRIRYDDEPPGASFEAQRVHDPATGDVDDQWGESTTPLFAELVTDERRASLRADGVTWGRYPPEGDPAVVGTGSFQVDCTLETF